LAIRQLIMKGFGYLASILNGSNLLVSSTRCNWSKLKKGGLVKIGEIDEYFTINHFERIVYAKPFTVKNRNCISVTGNIKPYIINADQIVMTLKQYELSDEYVITDGGSGFKPGDLLFYDQGAEHSILLKVTATLNDSVSAFTIVNRGTFSNEFHDELKFNSESGQNFRLISKSQEKAEKQKIDRECLNVVYNPEETLIYFAHTLPGYIKSGEISLTKWTCKLNREFLNSKGDHLNQQYKFFVELTPHYSFPLLLQNHQKPEDLLNNIFYKIDAELHSLQQQINKLSNG
jgi:hypothetical protein